MGEVVGSNVFLSGKTTFAGSPEPVFKMASGRVAVKVLGAFFLNLKE